MDLQVSDPRKALDEAHVGALHTAASLFSLEAGGGSSGTLAPPTPANLQHPSGRGGAAGPARSGQRSAGRGRHPGRFVAH